MNPRRVVVTGMGVVACNGVGLEKFWRANAEGRSGVSRIDAFEADDFPSRIAGQVRGFEPRDHMPEETADRVDRFVHFGLACAAMALGHSRLEPAAEADRIGVIIGSGVGGQWFHEEQLVAAFDRGRTGSIRSRCRASAPTRSPRRSRSATGARAPTW